MKARATFLTVLVASIAILIHYQITHRTNNAVWEIGYVVCMHCLLTLSTAIIKSFGAVQPNQPHEQPTTSNTTATTTTTTTPQPQHQSPPQHTTTDICDMNDNPETPAELKDLVQLLETLRRKTPADTSLSNMATAVISNRLSIMDVSPPKPVSQPISRMGSRKGSTITTNAYSNSTNSNSSSSTLLHPPPLAAASSPTAVTNKELRMLCKRLVRLEAQVCFFEYPVPQRPWHVHLVLFASSNRTQRCLGLSMQCLGCSQSESAVQLGCIFQKPSGREISNVVQVDSESSQFSCSE